jgi:hypothetical protein
MITELATPASSMVLVASSSGLGGNPACRVYSLASGLVASMNALTSLIVWLVLKRATKRLPSANLIWREVDGKESSTVIVLGAVAVLEAAALEVLLSEGATRVLRSP